MTQTVAQVRQVVLRSGFSNPLTLGVLVADADYVEVYADEELLTIGSDYTIDDIGDPNGVNITIIGAEDIDNYIGYETFTAVYRPPLDQQADFSLGGGLARPYEVALDQQNRRLQSLGDRVLRSIKMPVFIEGDIVLPPPVDGFTIAWDEDAGAFVWVLGGLTGAPGPRGPAGLVQAVAAGTGISVDDSDPANPEVAVDTDVIATQAYVDGLLGTIASRNLTVSTDDPSGGSDGDIWFKIEA
jgi:hypothetical protein